LAREDSFDSTRAEIFEALGHPMRIRILYALEGGPMGFSSLKKEVEIDSSGHLQFHLGKLHHMVKTNAEGSYALTDDGKEAIRVLSLTSSSGMGPQARAVPTKGRNWTKSLLAGVLIFLIVLGAIAVFEQQQIAMQQGQITSQEQQIALYVNEVHPFANGQSGSLVLGQKDFTTYRPTTSQSGIDDPVQAIFDHSGNLWVLDSGNIRILEFRPPFSSGMNASLVIGQKNYSTSHWSVAKDGFGGPFFLRHEVRYVNGPWAAAFDHSGSLWISDVGNNRVLEFKPPFATGMSASIVIGQKDFLTRSAGNSSRGLNAPTGIAFDSVGNLLVVYSVNNRVLEFRPPFSNGMNATLVIGQPSFTTNNGYVGDDEAIGLGYAIAFDSAGNLWATYHQRLLEFNPPFTTSMSASLEIGQPDLASAALWVGGQNGLDYPAHPGFDQSGNLWVPDGENHRVLEFVSGFPTRNTSTGFPGAQPILLFQLSAIGTAVLVGVTLSAVLIRRRGRQK
jgi:DNA-binding beta-propeller fold protein YncE/DNA-binding HxlR family transcriptional regulator